MKATSSRIGTRVALFFPNDDNQYTSGQKGILSAGDKERLGYRS